MQNGRHIHQAEFIIVNFHYLYNFCICYDTTNAPSKILIFMTTFTAHQERVEAKIMKGEPEFVEYGEH